MAGELVRFDPNGTAMAVDPASGEVLVIAEQPTNTLVEFRERLRAELRDLQSEIDSELIARMDQANRRTLRLDDLGYTMTVTPGDKIEWDGWTLYSELNALFEDGLLDQGAIQEAVTKEVDYKVHATAAARLLGHPDERVREAAIKSRTVSEQNRYVRLKRERKAA